MTTKGTHPSDRFVGYVIGKKAFIQAVKAGDRFVYFVPVDFADSREALLVKYQALGLSVS